MMRALNAAASGMDAQQTRLDVTANNIANVSTPGFKRVRAEFAEMMVDVERAPGATTTADGAAPIGVEVGMGARTAGTSRLFTQGDMLESENPLDLAIEGDGFFAIESSGGEVHYTRDGAFKLDAERRLVTSRGEPLVGDLVVPPDADQITIGADGVVTANVYGEITPVEVGRIQLANFANPAGLTALGGNMFKETVASGPALLGAPGENGTGKIDQGMRELSNVKVVEEMVDLISGQRAYEVSARVIKAADEMLQQAVNIR